MNAACSRVTLPWAAERYERIDRACRPSATARRHASSSVTWSRSVSVVSDAHDVLLRARRSSAMAWAAIKDELGTMYYPNTATRHTSWTKPPEMTGQGTAAVQPCDWTEKMDPNTGKVYYVNTATKQTAGYGRQNWGPWGAHLRRRRHSCKRLRGSRSRTPRPGKSSRPHDPLAKGVVGVFTHMAQCLM
jgi:hypothetical protein